MLMPKLASFVVALAVGVRGTTSFTPGAICNGVDANSLASQLLRGKHLHVLELEWFPFAVKNVTASYGWTGLDVDLLTRVASMLNFTFEIHESGMRAEGESWSDVLVRTVDEGDLWASWWNQDADRSASARLDPPTSAPSNPSLLPSLPALLAHPELGHFPRSPTHEHALCAHRHVARALTSAQTWCCVDRLHRLDDHLDGPLLL